MVMDTDRRVGHNAAMRSMVAIGFLLIVAGCSGGPGAYGITGPGQQPLPAGPALPGTVPDTYTPPGVSTTGTFYGPTNGPTAGSSGYYGYN